MILNIAAAFSIEIFSQVMTRRRILNCNSSEAILPSLPIVLLFLDYIVQSNKSSRSSSAPP